MNKDCFYTLKPGPLARLALCGLVVAVLLAPAACTRKIAAPVVDGRNLPTTGTEVAGPGIHIVRKGDTVLSISRQYGVAARDIIAWNNLASPNQIEVGQAVRIAPPGSSYDSNNDAVVAEAIPVRSESMGDPAYQQTAQQAAPFAPSPVLKSEPRGGKEPYSDEAWARVQNPAGVTRAPEPVVAPPPQQQAANVPPPAVPVSTSATATAAASGWMWPVKGKILVGYNGGDPKLPNKGLDIAGKPGTPVLAAAAGKVVYAGSGLPRLGNMIIIQHDADYLTAYAHNQTLLVKEKETVSKGQKIAELGSTGATDQPKLHFELRKQGQPVDPVKYLPAP
jgi:lipoprotein NlpD